jgi:hypothetical protein
LGEVIRRLKQGETVSASWRLPGNTTRSIPVEVVTLPDGEESIEVVQQRGSLRATRWQICPGSRQPLKARPSWNEDEQLIERLK